MTNQHRPAHSAKLMSRRLGSLTPAQIVEVARAISSEPCYCDRMGIGDPAASCGDCPTRDWNKVPATKKPGRPTLPDDERRSHTVRARVTAEEAAKYERIGAADWLRAALKRAKVKDQA